jgi:dipeptidyl aminopeptidase/acylaminoacyl peptidase
MYRIFLIASLLSTQVSMAQQQQMTPETLWKLGRVSGEMVTKNGTVIYGVTHVEVADNKSERNLFAVPVKGGATKQITQTPGSESGVQELPNGKLLFTYKGQIWEMDADGSNPIQKTNVEGGLSNVRISPKGTHLIYSKELKLEQVLGSDIYADLPKSNVQVYTSLNYRHWDTWSNGTYQHVFVARYHSETGEIGTEVDIMKGELFDCPQKPFGGAEDFIFDPSGTQIIYVTKKLHGTDYAQSTNTDIFRYDIATGKTENLSAGMMGYDVHPVFSPDGKYLSWNSMARDGYEADKNDIILYEWSSGKKQNLTKDWDGTVNSHVFDPKGKTIYFVAPTQGTIQIFTLDIASKKIHQLTKGVFDVNGIIGIYDGHLIVSRNDMNTAAEIYKVRIKDGSMQALTQTNEAIYKNIGKSKIEERWVPTTDGKQMLVWVIYPPDFDPNKKYPTLLYCQGGPQSALSQYYSFRWNFQLMAAQGYIVVAPNRRGMPGHGTAWNEAISKDWGGQAIQDYLSAIDAVSQEPFVDKNRLGAVGASYGGYSVFQLAGVHENRFKTFISHCGLFDIKSWYGTTEELFFANYDIGNYWDPAHAKGYQEFSPSNFVTKWNTPILIIQGGLDFRVPIEQGLQAFQVAQLRGIKSKLVYFPDENHWVTKPQNAIAWQREFFGWLKETL